MKSVTLFLLSILGHRLVRVTTVPWLPIEVESHVLFNDTLMRGCWWAFMLCFTSLVSVNAVRWSRKLLKNCAVVTSVAAGNHLKAVAWCIGSSSNWLVHCVRCQCERHAHNDFFKVLCFLSDITSVRSTTDLTTNSHMRLFRLPRHVIWQACVLWKKQLAQKINNI